MVYYIILTFEIGKNPIISFKLSKKVHDIPKIYRRISSTHAAPQKWECTTYTKGWLFVIPKGRYSEVSLFRKRNKGY